MIQRIEIVGQGVELHDDIKKYIRRKVGRLDRFVPKHARKTIHAEVKVHENSHSLQNDNKYECEVILHLPHQQLTAKEATLNMFAAVDIVETKLRNQLRRYKEQTVQKPRVKREKMRSVLSKLMAGKRTSKQKEG